MYFTDMSFPERQNCESYTKERMGEKKAAETFYNIAIDQLPLLGEQRAKILQRFIR